MDRVEGIISIINEKYEEGSITLETKNYHHGMKNINY